MNEIALLIAFLAGNTFNTDCVQTQFNMKSGYAVDSLSFGKSMGDNTILVVLERKLYADSKCAGELTDHPIETGYATFNKSSGGFFSTNDGEKRYSADWNFGNGIEEGSIGISEGKKEVRIARNQPGFMRNSMLQLISFKASK